MINLLIADDESYCLDGLKELFPWDKWNVRVVAAVRNGIEALDYVRANPVDMLLSDIRMPRMDGLALSGILHEEFPKIRIVLLTAFAEFEYVRKAMHYGVSEYLVKPVQFEALERLFVRTPRDTGHEDNNTIYRGYYEEIIINIKKLIEEHPESVSLESAAGETGFSPGYISRIFHKYCGLTFSEYLNNFRMNKAAELLMAGFSVEETALRIGYNNRRNFNRVFKLFFGHSPHEYCKG